ncbi:MAG: vancomycin resistance protein VanW [Actinomycetota bacterium]|jgi:vancomycin resistance protein VanW|nr:vancomycin resistance protein VanW [Actinomycetota bacterium]
MKLHAVDAPDVHDGVQLRRVVARRLRARSLIVERRVAWRLRPSQFPVAREANPVETPNLVYESRTRVARSDAWADPVLEQGKRVNVALAAPTLNGVLLEPGEVFSFWRTVGRPDPALGYRYGMELRGGCVVPAVGGGLCLLSNAMFHAAATLGWDIVERHGHTVEVVPPNDDPWGVDATIAWPYIDLRFAVARHEPAARLAVQVAHGELVVQVWAASTSDRRVELTGVDDRVETIDGQRVRRNRIARRVVEADGTTRTETIAENAKRLLAPSDLGRSCLTCGIDTCAGRVTIR